MSANAQTPEPAALSVLAHAKVNLFLAVGSRRADGFHDVTTILQALELGDAIEVAPIPGAETVVERDYDPGVPVPGDLAYRAAEAWRAATGHAGGIRIRVAKRIPVGAGLGGGSADAAGVLAALAAWTGTDPERDPAARTIAASLGADVPYFLGPGTQLMTGRGDEPARTLPTPDLYVALVNPNVASPTGAVYAQFDRMGAAPPEGPDRMIQALEEGRAATIAGRLYNNMTEAAVALVPEIAGALRCLEDAPGLLGRTVAGSGSTAFGIFDSAQAAHDAAGMALERGWWACATATASRALESAPCSGE